MKKHDGYDSNSDQRSHMMSGGRYPVLRTIAILYLAGSVAVGLFGLFLAGWCLFGAPVPWIPVMFTPDWGSRIMACITMIGATFFGVISMLAIAEGIKLFIDGANSLRLVASRSVSATAPATDVVVSSGAVVVAPSA